jgi:hypothetical protein
MLHDIRVRRRYRKERVTVECVPTEELLVSRDGRDLDHCLLVAHRSLKTYSDLVKMGYTADQLDNMSGLGDVFMWNVEAVTRNPAINAFNQMPSSNDGSATKVVYNECYVLIDKDGDGIAERRKVCMVGNTVLHDEVVNEVPFAILCPDPEPHMIIGNSVADQTMDLQLLKSNVVRNTLDSLAQSIHPRTSRPAPSSACARPAWCRSTAPPSSASRRCRSSPGSTRSRPSVPASCRPRPASIPTCCRARPKPVSTPPCRAPRSAPR